MGYKVVWSPKAIEDVEAIASYIARDSVSYAAAVVKKILDSTRSLSNFALSGKVVPEFDEDVFREQTTYGYRIIYRIRSESVTVASVVHCKRLLELDMKP